MRAGESVRRVVSLSRRVVASGRRGVMSVVRRAGRVVRRWVSGLVAERRSGGRRSVVGGGGLVGGLVLGGWGGVWGRDGRECWGGSTFYVVQCPVRWAVHRFAFSSACLLVRGVLDCCGRYRR
jgi:hypothetical protein